MGEAVVGAEYAHEIGRMLGSCSSSDERVALCRLLAATGSPDAQGYLVDALADETDERAAAAIRQSLVALDAAMAG